MESSITTKTSFDFKTNITSQKKGFLSLKGEFSIGIQAYRDHKDSQKSPQFMTRTSSAACGASDQGELLELSAYVIYLSDVQVAQSISPFSSQDRGHRVQASLDSPSQSIAITDICLPHLVLLSSWD